MSVPPKPDPRLDTFKRFLRGETNERIFAWPTGHPSQPTGFCACDRGPVAAGWFYLKAAVLLAWLRWPFNAPKLFLPR